MTGILIPQDVTDAASRLSGVVARTPLLRSQDIDHDLGVKTWFKAEALQRTNSFKFRGAYHRVSRLSLAEQSLGVVGASSGNHAQALALTGRLLGVATTVVVPDDCPGVKVEAAEAHGATIVRYQRHTEDRDEIVHAVSARTGAIIVPSSDHADVMAGNGTVGLEMLEDCPDLDTLLVPIGGGGLAAGCAVIAKHMNPSIRVIGVEPEGADDTFRSLQHDRRIAIDAPSTVADGLRHLTPSEKPWEINRRLLDGIILVSDADVLRSMRLAFDRLKLIVEPSGACAIAALIAGSPLLDHSDKVGVVLTGGNVDWNTYSRMTKTPEGSGGKPGTATDTSTSSVVRGRVKIW